MTIWHFFCVTAFFAPIVPAYQQPQAAHASFGGYAISMLIGLLLGTLWAFALGWLTKKLFTASSDRSDSLRVGVAIATAIASVAWIIGREMCGDHVVKLVLHAA